MHFSDNTGPLVHETHPTPTHTGSVSPSGVEISGHKALLLRPIVSVLEQGVQGALSLFCLTRAAILPILADVISDRSAR